MTRELKVLSAGWQAEAGEPLTVTLNVISRDLKAQPVHRIPLTRDEALRLARQLLQSIEQVEDLRRDVK